MTDFNLGTGAEGPINRTGAPDTQIEGMDTQATLVGFKDDGSGNYQLVEADAGAEANGGGEVPVAGVFFQEQVIDMEDIPSGMFLQDLEEQLVAENKTIKGDRGTFIFGGVEMVNNDDDTSFTPGEPVYLDVGGGFTQTPPISCGRHRAGPRCLRSSERGCGRRHHAGRPRYPERGLGLRQRLIRQTIN